MWTYILRRLLLMIPTLFGITVVSFCVMKLAPGDPMLSNLGSSGATSSNNQTRDAYLLQKRELKLDKPILLNFRQYHNYGPELRIAAHYRALTESQILAEIPTLNAEQERAVGQDTEAGRRYRFLRGLRIPEFNADLVNAETHERLAKKIAAYTQVWSEDVGAFAVPAAIELLQQEAIDKQTKIGVFRCLTNMVVDPFVYTYSNKPTAAETPRVVATWKLWWKRNEQSFPPPDADARQALADSLKEMTDAKTSAALFDLLDNYDRDQAATFVHFFAEKLLGESTQPEKVACTLVLQRSVSLLRLDTPLDAADKQVADVAENWLVYYEAHRAEFEPSVANKLAAIFTDTQYAHMVYRLATFSFGLTAVRPRESVSDKILRALLVSAPIMAFSQLFIYLIAVPLGILCAAYRSGWTDRLVSLSLFLLYSIPPFVAGMLLLVFLCYGGFLKWFPMDGLHSSGSERMGWGAYLIDYAWHAVLPVICTSLFSLASVAMYSRSSLLDAINQDYIRTARAKGLSGRVVILKHALRNSLIPVLTLFSNIVPAMLGGSVLIEDIFNIPGMGRLSIDTLRQFDYPTLMALVFVEAIVVMLSILVTDLLYVFTDPRINFESREAAG